MFSDNTAGQDLQLPERAARRLWAACDTHNNNVKLEPTAAGDRATGGRVRLLLSGRPPAEATDTLRSKEQPRTSCRDEGDERAALPELLLLRYAERHGPQHPHPVARGQVLQVVHQTVPLHGCDAQEGTAVVLWLFRPPPPPSPPLASSLPTHPRCRRCPSRCGGP